MTERMRRRGWLLGLTLALALVAAACGGADDAGGSSSGGSGLSGKIVVDGSSTVAPISEAITEEFRKEQPNVDVTVGTSGTGGGFTKFCNGETDISDASRAIKDEEKQACEAKGIKYQEFRVGLDGLAVVTSSKNQFLDTLTFKQLAEIFKDGGATTWNQVDPKFPNEKIAIFAPDTESGTYDFFNEKVLGDPEELLRLITKCKKGKNADNPVCQALNALPSLPTGGPGLPTLTLPTQLPTLLPRTDAEARRVPFGPRGPTVRQLSRLYDPALVSLLVPGMVTGR